MDKQFAFTKSSGSYPAYFKFTVKDDCIQINLRGDPEQEIQGVGCGKSVSVEFGKTDIKEVLMQVLKELRSSDCPACDSRVEWTAPPFKQFCDEHYKQYLLTHNIRPTSKIPLEVYRENQY
jgi:endogenous inhibitor of DNA gyrase (YacG/DUF329 family)